MPDTVSAGDDHLGRQPDKQPVLDNARAPIKPGSQPRRLPDRAESAVENQVALIGPEWRAIGLLSYSDAGAQGFEEALLGVPHEGDNFHRQRPVGAEGR